MKLTYWGTKIHLNFNDIHLHDRKLFGLLFVVKTSLANIYPYNSLYIETDNEMLQAQLLVLTQVLTDF